MSGKQRKSVYLACRFSRRDEARRYAEVLKSRGVEVTSEWLWGTSSLPLPPGASSVNDLGPEGDHLKRAWGEKDYYDVLRADVLVHLTDPPEQNVPSPGGGMFVEFGVALASGKEVVVVGPRRNVFQYLSHVEQFSSFEALLQARWP